MLKKLIVTLIFAAVMFSLTCDRIFTVQPVEEQDTRELTTLEKSLSQTTNAFGFKLFREITQADPGSDIFISPLSISMALGMAFNGASGTTEEAMRNTLEFGNLTQQEINESFQSLTELLIQLDPDVRMLIANSLWKRLGFSVEPDFVDRLVTYFNAEVDSLDFTTQEAVDTINAWVSDNTEGLIDEIVTEIDWDVVLFLINVVYFKADWATQFDPDLTTDDFFTKSDGSQTPCRMMNQESNFTYYEHADFEAVDLPYGDGFFSMTILQPKTTKTTDDVIENMTSENWAQWMTGLTETELTLQMPKFKLEYELELTDVLTALGMSIAFIPNQADFSGINPDIDLFISKVLHKTFVQVDEEGTEAAAVTSVEISFTSVGMTLRIDRPFIFVIRENRSDSILFMGKIMEPVWE